MLYKWFMDKEHLIDLITFCLFGDESKIKKYKSYNATINYLNNLNLEQLRQVSKEFIF